MSSRVVKVSLNDDLRRIAVPAGTVSFAELKKQVCERFGCLSLRLLYVDEDGDRITLGSDAEVEEAFRLTPAPAPLRLFAVLEDDSSASSVVSSSSSSSFFPSARSEDEGYVVMEEQPGAAVVEENKEEAVAAVAAQDELPAVSTPVPVASPVAAVAGQDVLSALLSAFMPHLTPAQSTEVVDSIRDMVAGVGMEIQSVAQTVAAEATAAATAAAAPTPTPASAADVAVHSNVQCDHCQMLPLRGSRFKCSVCDDFDLCEACEAKSVHPANHPMIKLRIPFDEVSCRIERAEDNEHPHHPHHHHHPHPHHRHHHHHHHGEQSADAQPRCHRGHRRMHMLAGKMSQEARTIGKTLSAAAVEFAESVAAAAAAASESQAQPEAGVPSAPPSVRADELQGTFVEDVTAADGTVMLPGTEFVKIWRFVNSGAAAWPASTRLMCMDAAPVFTGPRDVVIGREVAVGESIDLSVDLVAPSQAGRFVSFWRLSFDGKSFGHRVWCDITVSEPEPVVVAAVVEEEVVAEVPEVEQLTENEMLLCSMGFDLPLVRAALSRHGDNVDAAVNELLG